MPHLRFRGCKLKEVQHINDELVKVLSELLDTPKEYFTVEHIDSIYTSIEEYPVSTVHWFDRGREMKQKVANIITDFMYELGYKDVCVYFEDLIKENYFENKEHF